MAARQVVTGSPAFDVDPAALIGSSLPPLRSCAGDGRPVGLHPGRTVIFVRASWRAGLRGEVSGWLAQW